MGAARHADSAPWNWDEVGVVIDGTYRLRATYVDRGGQGVGPITRREERPPRSPRLWVSHADRRKGAALSMFFDGGFVEVHLNAADGRLLDTIEIEPTLLLNQAIVAADISGVSGIHDVYLVFRGYEGESGALFVLTTVEFKRKQGDAG